MHSEPKMNQWQARYKDGYAAYVEHSSKKEWIAGDIIPDLDADGCSDLIMLHFNHMSNPVGIDTPEHAEAGFFHAQSGKYGNYYTLQSRRGKASQLLYMPDGWKQCDRPEKNWLEAFKAAKNRIEQGDWNF